MTKRKPDEFEQPEAAAQDMEPTNESVELAPPDVLQQIAREWISDLVEKTPSLAADRIAAELHAAGIHTQDQLAHANVNLIRRALTAALQADAHSLTGLAARFQMEE